MNAKYIKPFLVSAQTVLDTMAEVPLESEKPFLRRDHECYGELRSLVTLQGESVKGQLSIAFDDSLLESALRKMFGEEDEEGIDQAQAIDAVCELTNMIVGKANHIFSSQGTRFRYSIPHGMKNQERISDSIGKSVIIPFNSPVGRLYIEIVFEKKRKQKDQSAQKAKDISQFIGPRVEIALTTSLKILKLLRNQSTKQMLRFMSMETMSSILEVTEKKLPSHFKFLEIIHTDLQSYKFSKNISKLVVYFVFKNTIDESLFQRKITFQYNHNPKLTLEKFTIQNSNR